MRLIVPHTRLHPATKAWAHTHHATLVDVSSNDSSYHDLLARLWSDPEDLWLVEHDMLPPAGAQHRMSSCPRRWCVNPYTVGSGVHITRGLGSTRFRAELLTDHPDLLEQVALRDDPGIPAKHWVRLDWRLTEALTARGETPHPHARAKHLHVYPKGG